MIAFPQIRTVHIGPDENYSLEYEWDGSHVMVIRYFHLGFEIDSLPEKLRMDLVSEAYQQEQDRGIDHGDDRE